MAVPDSYFPHIQREKARRYKAEFLSRMFGVTSASAEGGYSREGEFSSESTIFDIASKSDNIIGLGFGSKLTAGNVITGEEAIRVYVREKATLSSLPGSAIIPPTVNGIPTDVIPIGDLVAAARPTPCGVSIGHHAITAGTLGCIVRKAFSEDDELYILSNNHVLANCDQASIGDLILEPGPYDGGRLDDPIAHLADFEPITNGKVNTVDAAIARLLVPSSVTRDILGIGNVQQPPLQATINQSVLKYGRTTQLTQGIVEGIDEDIPIRYGSQRLNFEGQLAIRGANGPFASVGDSGSLIVDADTRNPVGLFFAVDRAGVGTAFANHIEPVLARFGVEIL